MAFAIVAVTPSTTALLSSHPARHDDSKGKQGDRRHNDGDRRHDDGDGRHGDGNGRHDDGWHDDGLAGRQLAR